jgi:hypothetical protein
MVRKHMLLALGCAAALLAACDAARGNRPIDPYRSGSDIYSRTATTHGGDTYDDRGVAGSSTSGRVTILRQGGSDYDPRRDLGRSDDGAGSGSDYQPYDRRRY